MYANRNRGDPVLNHLANFIFWTLAIAILLHIEGLHPKIEGSHTYIPIFILSVLLICIVNVRITQGLGIPGLVFLATIILYVIISYIVAVSWNIQVPTQIYRIWGVTILFLVIFMASALGSYVTMEARGIETTFLWVLRLFTVTSAVIAFSPILIGWGLPLVKYHSFRHSAPYLDPNNAGIVSCLTVTMAIVFIRLSKHKLLAYIALSTGFIATALTGSRTAVIVSFAVFIFFLLFAKRRTWLFLFSLVSSGLLIGFSEEIIAFIHDHSSRIITGTLEIGTHGLERGRLWEIGIQQAIQSPVFGSGLGTGVDDGMRLGVHNLYLSLFIEAGFIPVLLYIIYLFSILRLFLSAPTSLARDVIVGWVIVLMLFSVTFHHLFTLKVLAFVIGLSCATSQLLYAQTPPVRKPAPSPG